ncbi:Tl.2 family protein [Megaselia abdita]
MSTRFIFFVVFLIKICAAFDVNNFVNSFCDVENNMLSCSNFSLIPQEIYEVQTEDFIISNHNVLEFSFCSIGIVNENFFTKFPEALSINFKKCNVSMDSSIYPTSNRVVKLNDLSFSECRFMNNKDTNALNTLNMLSKFSILYSWFHHKELDRHFLRNLTNLTEINCYECGFHHISNGAFDDLDNLKSFNFEGSNVTHLPNGLLEKSRNLESFSFVRNDLRDIPMTFLPKSVKNVNLETNSISILKKNQFKGLINLEYLDLSNNQIGRIHKRGFNGLEHLKELNMNFNNITVLTKRHFQGLDYLKQIYLLGNQIGPNQKVFEELKRYGVTINY